ncbi:BTB/POZ domain-containing protein At2g46260-like [Lolium perenne]|uniref:BTB/POZ domain-containing protein At2g46260-like n=1 Tax=Lolium perenne TaxID=4522 RepID=UPI0021EB1536|nr:BTB/POZ domain-containing protein At2g46260-like [Lolium perenne]
MGAGKDSESAAGPLAEAEMDLDFSRGGVVPSFEFAFNSANFSDRVLRIEIVACDNVPGYSGDIGGGSIGDFREDKGNEGQSVDSSAMIPCTPVLREKTIYVNSAILASRSPFFLKLFSNGMKESDQTHPALRIADSEENGLMELLSYMYRGKLTTKEPTVLLDVLMAADKFEVLSCMRHSSQLLTSLPMTTESALLYIEHPCSTSLAADVQRVIGVAKEFLANKYKDFDEFEDELMNISLAGIEAIFSSSDICVETEDDLYFFMVDWARARYPELEERRKILSSRLLPLVRFSHMTCETLRKILACTDNDIDHELVNKRITEALLHIAYPTEVEGALAAEVRAYTRKPVRVVAIDGPCPHVIVYLDLTSKECSRFLPSKGMFLFSHPFYLAGQEFNLVAVGGRERGEATNSCGFGLYLQIQWDPESSKPITLDCEFAAKRKSSGKFVMLCNDELTVYDECVHGYNDLFQMSWLDFITDNDLFIDDVLHLRADVAVVGQLKLKT